jgi:ribonuclease P protein component
VKRDQRLRSAADFRHARDAAPRAWADPLVVLYAAPSDRPMTRVGITVSGRVGKAVIRNRVRRRIREVVRARLAELPTGHDLLLIARPSSATASWTDLKAAVERLLARAGLLSTATV